MEDPSYDDGVPLCVASTSLYRDRRQKKKKKIYETDLRHAQFRMAVLPQENLQGQFLLQCIRELALGSNFPANKHKPDVSDQLLQMNSPSSFHTWFLTTLSDKVPVHVQASFACLTAPSF